jgi:hypothetical protein
LHDNSKQMGHIQSSQLPYIPQVPYAILTQSNNTTPISKYSSAEKQFLYAKYTFINYLYDYINLNHLHFF